MLPTSMERFVRETAPEHDEIQAEMAAQAAAGGFPIIGPASGAFLRTVAHARDAQRIFEFGSGFGYSATWFLDGMGPDGRIVLTEIDADELEQGREYLQRRGDADRATFEQGDAMEIVQGYDDPFDVVLIDHQKQEYAAAFERIRDQLPAGAVVIADNIMDGPVWYEDLLPYLDGDTAPPAGGPAEGIVSYLETVRSRADCHTHVLPIGKGLAVTTITAD